MLVMMTMTPQNLSVIDEAVKILNAPRSLEEVVKALQDGSLSPGQAAAIQFLTAKGAWGWSIGLEGYITLDMVAAIRDLVTSGRILEASRLREKAQGYLALLDYRTPCGAGASNALQELDRWVGNQDLDPVSYEEDDQDWVYGSAAGDPDTWWVRIDGGALMAATEDYDTDDEAV